MSGFFAVLQLDGAPVDRAVLRELMGVLRFRGPDAEQVWTSGNIALGHAMFRTTFEAEHEVQPCSLGNDFWIVGDVRVDSREELYDKLASKGLTGLTNAADPELILHAYAVWGEHCVDHLLGDFSFAIWDATRRRLFCARDHLGIKGLYYAMVGRSLVLSNSLHCLRRHPDVSDRLNDLAICEFLLYGFYQEQATTSFADIQRLSPGRAMWWCNVGTSYELRTHQFWTQPIDEPIRYRRLQDYVEHFRELLCRSVGDRLRTNKAGIYMSGGLDSPLLAATAKQILARRSDDHDFRAFTSVCERPNPDERHYAGQVAQQLKIPIHYQAAGQCHPYERWCEGNVYPPEPDHEPFRIEARESFGEVARMSRVVFYGEGPDDLLRYEWRPYLSHLVSRGEYKQAAGDVLKSFWVQPRIAFSTSLVRRAIKRHQRFPAMAFPRWLRQDVASQFGLRERWKRYWQPINQGSNHPLRPVAYGCLQAGQWQRLFQSLDPDWTGVPLEVRHPYLDIRVVRFFLAVPVLPWCRRKHLLRAALQGLVPESVRRREKSPLRVELLGQARSRGGQILFPGKPHEGLFRYIEEIPDTLRCDDRSLWFNTLPFSLSLWLEQQTAKTSIAGVAGSSGIFRR